jgi:Trp operon repressor
MGMKKRKKVKLLQVQAGESIQLHWKVRRQVQQEILQKKLMQCFLRPSEGDACIKRYPEAMQPMIRDFMRKADEQTRLQST